MSKRQPNAVLSGILVCRMRRHRTAFDLHQYTRSAISVLLNLLLNVAIDTDHERCART